MTSNNNYHDLNKTKYIEGFTQQIPGQCSALNKILDEYNIKNVMEIGFNAGHSADLFLKHPKNIELWSFDIGQHQSVKSGKTFIDNTYPARHRLILGNSLTTIPDFINNNIIKFDLIFIDGGHDYNVSKNDLLNCKNLAHSNTIVIMDDTVIRKEWVQHWNIGPMRAWDEAKKDNMVKEISCEEYSSGRGQSWGKYIL